MTVQPHPEPPPDLPAHELPLVTLEQPWWRFHQCRFGAVHFGRSGNSRFDPPQGPQGTYSVLYAATDVHGAFIETLGRVTGQNRVDMQTLREIRLALLETARPLNLVDLTGAGLARIGADARLCTMDDYALCGRWALALWGHPQQPDGLYYRARHDQQRLSLALFDRDEIVNAVHDYAHGPLADPKHATLLGDILDTYRFQLIP